MLTLSIIFGFLILGLLAGYESGHRSARHAHIGMIRRRNGWYEVGDPVAFAKALKEIK